MSSSSPPLQDRIVYSVRDVRRLLGLGEVAARKLVRELGFSISPRHTVIAREVLERYVANKGRSSPDEGRAA